MSFLARIWQSIRNTSRLVGRDLEGNRFFESPNALGDGSRPRRTVQYHDPEVVWDYVGGKSRLPVQWSMWLSHTRAHPPTQEELQADLDRQRRVLANVAILEAKEEAAKLQLSSPPDLRAQQQQALHASAERTAPSDPKISHIKTQGAETPVASSPEVQSPWKPAPTSWQPESWTPPRSRPS